MNTINRRNFLKKSVFGVGSLLLANAVRATENFGGIFSNQPPATVADSNLMALYRQGKEHFYRKEYVNANSIFLQLIENHQNKLFLYDGQAKVFCAQQNLAAAAELYRQGAAKNPKNAQFLHRYALILRNLCLGNATQAQQFASQYSVSNLYETAAQQLIMAISLKPQEKGLKLDLKDFPLLLEKYNANRRNAQNPLFLSAETVTQINNLTSSVSTKWTKTRASHKPAVPPENTTDNTSNRNKQKRNLHTQKEQQERQKAEKKSKNRVSYVYLKNNMGNKNTNKVERWGLQILADDIKNTQAVGQMRKYFRKNKHSDRIISVNRYFYNNNETLYSALALAAALVRYNNNTPSLNEAKQLLNSVNQQLDNATLIAKGSYYGTLAKVQIKEHNTNAARNTLLEGLAQFDGQGGVAYSLLEQYVATFDKQQKTTALNIQKALCGKDTAAVNNPVWNYVEKYREYLGENEINKTEKIKALVALSKLQKTFKDSGYNDTITEINNLKNV